MLQNTFDTSTPAVAAPWSMRPWLWEDDVNTAAAVWDLVDGCRDHDLPLGAVLIDSPWATRYNNFKFDEKRYPNPRGMIDALPQARRAVGAVDDQRHQHSRKPVGRRRRRRRPVRDRQGQGLLRERRRAGLAGGRAKAP